MSPVVFSVLREAPRISVLVRALVQDIKYKPNMLNLKQLFLSVKHSLLTFLTASCVFSNTFLCLHFLPFRSLSVHSSRLHCGKSKLEAKRGFFAPRVKTRGSVKHVWRNIPKQSIDFFHIWKDIFHQILYVYTSLISCSLYLLIYSDYRNGRCFKFFLFFLPFNPPSCLGANVSPSLFCCQFRV